MIKSLLITFFLFSGFSIFAQQSSPKITIKGIVEDSTLAQPLGYVTVVLRDQKSGNIVKSMLTKEDGSFDLTVPENQYLLTLVYVGYLPKKISISGEKSLNDLGKITICAALKQLNDVVITADKPLLTKEIDRISFDVQADPESKSNDALEMLRKVPMITVDGNDIIQLKGSTNFQIFINGKPSALMVNNPSDVLKAMPGATIKKIEVITIPPSKYDGEGLSGIINIITLERHDEGVNGSLFGRYNSVYGERSSISLNVKKEKLGVNIILGAGHQPNHTVNSGSDLTTFSPASDLSQVGQTTFGGNFDNGRADLSYEADSLDLITGTVDFVRRRFSNDPMYHSRLLILPDSIGQSYRLNNTGENTNGAIDAGFNFQRSFKHNKNELLTFSYQFAHTNYKQTNDIIIADPVNYLGTDNNQSNNTKTNEHTLQVDFVDPVKNLVFETGAKMILRTNNSYFSDANLNETTGQYNLDTSLTNQFAYHQNVYSIYNTYQLKVSSWTFKGGARGEYTFIDADLLSGSLFPNQHYINVLPSVSIQRDYKKSGIVSLGYAERIERPNIRQLNPFVDRSNPDFIVMGNPALRPVLNHIVELSYSKFGNTSFNASLNYAFANNTVQSVTSIISDTLSKTTYLNVGKTQSSGINISANYPITDKFTFNINAQISHIWLTGVYNSQSYKNNGNVGNAAAFTRYNFNNSLNATLNWGYNSGNLYLQGKSSDLIFSSLNVIKDFFHKKFTASLTVYDPFIKYSEYTSYTRTPDFYESTYSQNFYRNIRLALNYKFGSLKSNMATNKRGIKNDDVKSAGNGGEN